MGRIVRMTASEIDKMLTPEKIREMLANAKSTPATEYDMRHIPEEWWAKAERPNQARQAVQENAN